MTADNKKFLKRILHDIERGYGKVVRDLCECGFHVWMKYFKKNGYDEGGAFAYSVSMFDPWTVSMIQMNKKQRRLNAAH